MDRRAFLMEIDPLYCDVIVQRWEAFVAQGSGCRATYFNLAKKLCAVEDIPPCKLFGQPPRAVSPIEESVVDMLKRRHRGIGEG